MDNIKARIEIFTKLGARLQELTDALEKNISSPESEKMAATIARAGMENGWFTRSHVIEAFRAIAQWMTHENLSNWIAQYPDVEKRKSPRTIAVIMAGNIPMVNFHDFLSVLISGNNFLGKLSSKDSFLLPYCADLLKEINPVFAEKIQFANGTLQHFDAVIATGSSNSSRYFEYYFSKYPNIIRKNRSSAAVLSGNETPEEIAKLGVDIFAYFGLGCRNVSRIFLPEGLAPESLFPPLEKFSEVVEHHKYKNNYDYRKSILLVNKIPFKDNGFLILHETPEWHSPVGQVNVGFYSSLSEMENLLSEHDSEIQCIASNIPLQFPRTVPLGETQHPTLMDYPDGVDIMRFLEKLP